MNRLDAIQPLLAPCAASWLIYVALGALLASPALRIYDAGTLPFSHLLDSAAYALAPDAMMRAVDSPLSALR